MTPPISPASPWGTFAPPRSVRVLLALARAVPPARGVRQLALLIRSLARTRISGPVDVRLWGFRLRMEPRGNVSEGQLLFMPRLWDRRERAMVRRWARPGLVFVDVGANFGGYTWWVLHLLGDDCRIVAVEADPELGSSLQAHLDENEVRNVTVLPVAVGGGEGRAILRVDRRNRGESALAGSTERPEEGIAVVVRPLAALLGEQGLERVDLLKIDIEGMELPVLDSYFAQAPAASWPRRILCELKATPEHEALARLLHQRGYVVEARTRRNAAFMRT